LEREQQQRKRRIVVKLTFNIIGGCFVNKKNGTVYPLAEANFFFIHSIPNLEVQICRYDEKGIVYHFLRRRRRIPRDGGAASRVGDDGGAVASLSSNRCKMRTKSPSYY
jgi:hypothetical protein